MLNAQYLGNSIRDASQQLHSYQARRRLRKNILLNLNQPQRLPNQIRIDYAEIFFISYNLKNEVLDLLFKFNNLEYLGIVMHEYLSQNNLLSIIKNRIECPLESILEEDRILRLNMNSDHGNHPVRNNESTRKIEEFIETELYHSFLIPIPKLKILELE